MNNSKVLAKENFLQLCEAINLNPNYDRDFLYEIYSEVYETIVNLLENTEGIKFTPVNHVSVLLYIVNEYAYSIKNVLPERVEKMKKDEAFAATLCSACADKYITNEQLNYKSQAFLNRFNPPISTLSLYLNFSLRVLNQIDPKDRITTLITDLLKKAFSMAKCIIELLTQGFETEAFSTWRTLHENESILITLIKYGEPMFDCYIKHINYALAYRGQIVDKEEVDKIFEVIKSEMKSHELKSKDMKKFIEYGYLFEMPGKKLNEDFKLNFRDGVEKAAGLSEYSKLYEMSSEISHSSPLLIYSNKEYYFRATVLCLYESFFRLEPIFFNLYRNYADSEVFESYKVLQKTYMHQLLYIYNDLKTKLGN